MTQVPTPEDPKPVGTVNGILPRCPVCGMQEWGRKLPGILKEGQKFREVIVGEIDGQLVGLSIVNFICKTCGFIRQHDSGFAR